MHYKVGEIVFIKFPFTNLQKAKRRPVLIIKSENSFNDFVCLQITSNAKQSHLFTLQAEHFHEKALSIQSYIKYDKCFTLNSSIVEKSVAQVTPQLLLELQNFFCNELFT